MWKIERTMRTDISYHISPTSGVPIYRQIVEQIERFIVTGQLKKGSIIPSVNQAARQMAVNPATVSRAYRVLLESGRLSKGEGDQFLIRENVNQSVNDNGDASLPGHAYRGHDPYVFVSYAHADRNLVNTELRWLSEEGFNVWYDEGISPGSSWDEEIANALGGCTLFLYFITPNSVESQNCRNEVNYCLSKGRKILCVYLENTQLPAGLELNLSANQAIMRSDLSLEVYRSKLHKTLLVSFPKAKSKCGQSVPDKNNKPLSVQRSIAILPFVNNTRDPGNDHLCDSLAGDLITALSDIDDLRVASQIDSFNFKGKNASGQQIAQALKVNNILSGSVQVSGSRIRVSVRLDHAGNATNLWSKRYEGSIDELFELQDEIASRVVEALSTSD